VSQIGAKQREKLEKKNENKQQKAFQPTEIIPQEIKEVKIHPPKSAATQNKKPEADKADIKTQTQSQAKTVNNKTQEKPQSQPSQPLIQIQPQKKENHQKAKENSNQIQYYQYEQENYYEEPFYKKPYEPNLLQSVIQEDSESQKKDLFPGFLEIPVAKFQQLQNEKMLIKINDIIKYKFTVFSPSKMTPVVSKWREGKIIGVEKNKLNVKRTDYVPYEHEEGEEAEEEEGEEDELYFHTLNSIVISRSCIDNDRIKIIEDLLVKEVKEKKPEIKDELEEKKKRLLDLQKKYEESEKNAMNDAFDYKLRMIANQVKSFLSYS